MTLRLLLPRAAERDVTFMVWFPMIWLHAVQTSPGLGKNLNSRNIILDLQEGN